MIDDGSRAGIVLVTTSFPTAGDGREAAGSFVFDLAMRLSERIPVRVVAPGDVDGVEIVDPRLTVFRYRAPNKALSQLGFRRPRELMSIVSVLWRGRRATASAVSAGPARGVLALWAFPSGMWARSACRKSGLPYSVWTLGSDIWVLGKIPLVRSYVSGILRGAASRYSDGLQLASDTSLLAGRDTVFLPSTRDMDAAAAARVANREPPYRLLFLGRWHTNKGIDLLLDALALLDDDAWARISLVHIAGGGPLQPRVEAGARLLREAGRPVRLDGYLDKENARAAIEDADMLLIPSRIESIPVVFSDAIKLGRPVVAMPVGDLPALVARYSCGVVAAEVSARAFAEVLARTLNGSIAGLIAGTTEAAEQFSLPRICDRLLSDMGGPA